MNRKRFLLTTAITGLVAAFLPKRGESAPMPPSEPYPMPQATEVREPILAPVGEGPKLCTFETPDGYWVIPRYRSGKYPPSPIYDPTGVGIRWKNGEGRDRGAWFHTTEEKMFSDAEALLLEARAGTLVNYPLGEGVSAELSDDVRDALRVKYRAHIAKTPDHSPTPATLHPNTVTTRPANATKHGEWGTTRIKTPCQQH